MSGYSRVAVRRSSVVVVFCLAFVLFAGFFSHLAAQESSPSSEPAAAVAHADSTESPHQKSKFMWFIESSGWIGAVLLLLSMYFIATVSRLFFELRLDKEMPPETVIDVNALVDQRNFQGVYDRLKADDTMFGRVAAAGLAEMNSGLEEARGVMERVGDSETVDMEKRISMLAVLGSLGPMIGLLGTLKGMIASFAVIALSDTQLKASEVAGGISEALLLTFEGVALSVPAIYFFAVFRNRVASISTAVVLEADDFLRRIVKVTRSAKAAGAAPVRA
ncbi:MAG: MotA/TolQ/ExbB proton channel family protein [Pirellulales bacterium]